MIERLVQGRGLDHRWVPLSRISPAMTRAVIASEDSGFCRHHGFELGAIEKALEHNERRPERIRGGSTISQQTAKNVFLWPERSWVRKGAEAWFTVLVEAINPRDMPGYFTNTQAQSASVCETVGLANLKMQIDCYHMQIVDGDLTTARRHKEPSNAVGDAPAGRIQRSVRTPLARRRQVSTAPCSRVTDLCRAAGVALCSPVSTLGMSAARFSGTVQGQCDCPWRTFSDDHGRRQSVHVQGFR
jgi:hypothetical protein